MQLCRNIVHLLMHVRMCVVLYTIFIVHNQTLPTKAVSPKCKRHPTILIAKLAPKGECFAAFTLYLQ